MCKAMDGASALHHPDSEFVCSGSGSTKLKVSTTSPGYPRKPTFQWIWSCVASDQKHTLPEGSCGTMTCFRSRAQITYPAVGGPRQAAAQPSFRIRMEREAQAPSYPGRRWGTAHDISVW